MQIDDLFLVHYCHPNCKPFQNIMRLPKEQAFLLAEKLAKENPDTTAFYRFADFANYYPRRLKTDEFLYDNFSRLGGKPKERHSLSFVLQGCDYLEHWFGKELLAQMNDFDGGIANFMRYVSEHYSYIEAQLWDDNAIIQNKFSVYDQNE